MSYKEVMTFPNSLIQNLIGLNRDNRNARFRNRIKKRLNSLIKYSLWISIIKRTDNTSHS